MQPFFLVVRTYLRLLGGRWLVGNQLCYFFWDWHALTGYLGAD
jgi:hypothetical protein